MTDDLTSSQNISQKPILEENTTRNKSMRVFKNTMRDTASDSKRHKESAKVTRERRNV